MKIMRNLICLSDFCKFICIYDCFILKIKYWIFILFESLFFLKEMTMKKLTILATLLPLAMMMGCSESGMSNSVEPSTTSESSKPQDSDKLIVLSKSGDNGCFVANGTYDDNVMGLECGGYRAIFQAYRIYDHGGYYVGGSATVGKITQGGGMDYPNTKGDFTIITVCGANCRLSGNDVVCDEVRGPYRSIRQNVAGWERTCGTMFDGDGHGIGLYGNRISVVSNMAVVVDNGTNHSKTLTATVAAGFFGNTEVAARMAKKYIYDVFAGQ